MLARLNLTNFRCFDTLRCEVSPGATAIVGANAQGKTSILEAICVGLRLQSPRTQTLRDLIRFGEAHFAVVLEFEGQDFIFGYANGRRRLTIDGEVLRRGSEYLQHSGLVVWMANDDLALVRGGGEGRRRFLDFLGCQLDPGYRSALRAYERALRARNFLLKRDASPRWREIDAYTELLAQHGEVLTACRRRMIEGLEPLAREMQRGISGSEETLRLSYEVAGGDRLHEALREKREEELRRRSTVQGPHRDDLGLELHGMPAGQFASEGQQRTIALALKLGQALLLRERRGVQPVLLLDDIFGELDPGRRNALIHVLPDGAQKVITTTHLDWLQGNLCPDVRYRLERGCIVREEG